MGHQTVVQHANGPAAILNRFFDLCQHPAHLAAVELTSGILMWICRVIVVNAGIDHDQPVIVPQIRGIRQRTGILFQRLVIAQIGIDFFKIRSVYGFCRIGFCSIV